MLFINAFQDEPVRFVYRNRADLWQISFEHVVSQTYRDGTLQETNTEQVQGYCNSIFVDLTHAAYGPCDAVKAPMEQIVSENPPIKDTVSYAVKGIFWPINHILETLPLIV